MEGENKKGLYLIVIVIVVIGTLWWLYSGPAGQNGAGSSSGEKPKPPQLAPALQLTPQEKSGDVSAKKAQIVARVRSGTPLTSEEKAEIGGIMLTKANLYQFSEEERQAIFKALSAK